MKKFLVPVYWYELHGSRVIIEANNEEEAIKKVSNSLTNMIGDIEGDTFSDFGECGIDDDAVELYEEREVESKAPKVTDSRFNYIKKDYMSLAKDIE